MIIHCTQKFAKKITPVSSEPLTETNPLGSWHAHLFIVDRRQCILFCHDKTRFSLFMAGLKKEDFSRLDFWFQDLFANTMLKLGYEPVLIEKALSYVDELMFDTHCDRSVQGTIRTTKLMDIDGMLYRVANVMDLPVYSISARLNDRPVSIKGMKKGEYIWPKKEMHKFLSGLSMKANNILPFP